MDWPCNHNNYVVQCRYTTIREWLSVHYDRILMSLYFCFINVISFSQLFILMMMIIMLRELNVPVTMFPYGIICTVLNTGHLVQSYTVEMRTNLIILILLQNGDDSPQRHKIYNMTE